MPEMITERQPVSDYELERGKPMPSRNHSIIQANVVVALNTRYRNTYSILSELSLTLGDVSVTPDVCVYPKLAIDWSSDVVKMTAPPLLAIEILSATQSTQDLVDKIYAMLRAGVKACWLVQPPIQAVTVFVDGAKPKTFTDGEISDALTGIALPIDRIFSAEQL